MIINRFRWPALGLVVLVLVLTVVFRLLDLKVSAVPAFLPLTLNIFFIGIPSCFITTLTIRSFLRTGSWPVFWMGAGALSFGIASISFGILTVLSLTNAAVTVHTLIILLGAVFFFTGNFFSNNQIPPETQYSRRLSIVLQIYLTAAASMIIFIMCSLLDWLPPFFIVGEGGTTLRQVLTGWAALCVAASGGSYLRQYFQTRSETLYWFSLGLLVIGVGLGAILIQNDTQSALNGTGKAAQLIGGVYLLFAAMTTLQEARNRHYSIGEAMAGIFIHLETRIQEMQEKYRNLFDNMTNGFSLVEIIKNTRGQPVDFRFLEVNQAWERMTGIPARKAAGKLATELFIKDAAESALDRMVRTAEEGTSSHSEVFNPPNGKWSEVYSYSPQKGYVASFFMDITDRKEAEAALARARDELELRVKERTSELVRATEELEAFNRRIIRAQEEERAMIAHELHEDTVQTLAILKMELSALLQYTEMKEPKTLERVEDMIVQTDILMQKVRRYSYTLHPAELESLGLEPALEKLADDLRREDQIDVWFNVSGKSYPLGRDINIVLFRIVQEGLNNIHKHAEASTVNIQLDYLPDSLKLMITDDGKGFNPNEKIGLTFKAGNLPDGGLPVCDPGLVGIRERAKLIKGNLRIESFPGTGTRITLEAATKPA